MTALIRFLAVLLACQLTGVPLGAEPLQGPFRLRLPADVKQRETECPPTPAPVQSLDLVSKYGDDGPERDDIDEEAEKAFDDAMLPVRDYAQQVVRMANRFTDKGRSGDAACTIRLLADWAKAGALANPRNATAVFKLATTLSSLSVAWLQVRGRAQPADRGTIDLWLSARATLIRILYDQSKAQSSKTGNHRAWAGFALAATGLAAEREDLVDWGLQSYETIICGAGPEGTLPQELRRGKKARDYHLFALAPLVMLAEIGESRGKASYAACDEGLMRVAEFTLASLADPAAIAEQAKADQIAFPDGKTLPPANRLAFMEPLLRRFPGRFAAEKDIIALRPLRFTDLGGDMTLLFGGPKP